jgi:DNA-3-methyladenine glycosylase
VTRAAVGRPLPRSFFARDPLSVAPELLHKVLVGPNGSAGRIVEVEAYDGDNDPGSHAYRGPTPRTRVMFGPAGHLYVYFTYGMHWCANVVCREEGRAAAVLVRALAPLRGIDTMRAARPSARRDVDLCRGPARLCGALGIDGACNGIDLLARSAPVRVLDDGVAPPGDPVCTTRVGLTRGGDLTWRWYVPGDPNVSRR